MLEIDQSFKTHANVTGKHILVIGSTTPWIEVLALRNGAKKVTSVDYVPVKNIHPDIEFLQASDFIQKYLKDSLAFDDIGLFVSFSSLEHAGLGR